MTSGHRITLTYSPYVRRGLGGIAGVSAVHDAQQLLAFSATKIALGDPLFFPNGKLLLPSCARSALNRYTGGILSKYCSYPYAHSTSLGIHHLPEVLKGSDMVTYEVFRSLGLSVSVRAVLDPIQLAGELGDHPGNVYYVSELIKPMGKEYDEVEPLQEILEYGYPHSRFKIKWLNKPTPARKDMQFVFQVVSHTLTCQST